MMIRENQRLFISKLDVATLFRQPDGYRMKTSTGSWWRDKLASWCWKLLHRLRAVEQYGFSEKMYTYTPAMQQEITKRLMEGINEIFRRDGDPDDYCLVLGAEDFSEMLDSEAIRNNMTIATSDIHYVRNGYKMSFRGLPVHVVPGVSGTAVIPKVIVEKEVPARLGAV